MSGFVDEAQIHAKGGNGGAGAVSFRREAHVDRGGPDGGDGGNGGDVWLVATTNQASLLGFRDHPHRRGTDGEHGSGKRRHGASGSDLVVPVPVGTVVKDRSGVVMCDLSHDGEQWLAAQGGRGGRGNARFLSNRRRAPAFAEQGELGQERWLDAELKLMADVALVGFPNVGKSTLISSVSAAKPKIADYPFTTLEPHLGVVRSRGAGRDDDVEFVMADVPGLVEGAADGRGLGHRFLRHIERASVLVLLIDLGATGGVSPSDQLSVLLGELAKYQPDLLDRPRLVVGSKADLTSEPQLSEAVSDIPIELSISAVTGARLAELVHRLSDLTVAARAANAVSQQADVVVHRPAPEGVRVERRGTNSWEILGRPAERAVGLSDLTDSGAMEEVLKRLGRLGVDRSLSRAGARDGDEVTVGDLSFTWMRYGSDVALEPLGSDGAPARRRRRKGGEANTGEAAHDR